MLLSLIRLMERSRARNAGNCGMNHGDSTMVGWGGLIQCSWEAAARGRHALSPKELTTPWLDFLTQRWAECPKIASRG